MIVEKKTNQRRRTRCMRCTTTSPAWSARWWAGWGGRGSCARAGSKWSRWRGRSGLKRPQSDFLAIKIKLWDTLMWLFCWQNYISNHILCLRASIQVYIAYIYAFTPRNILTYLVLNILIIISLIKKTSHPRRLLLLDCLIRNVLSGIIPRPFTPCSFGGLSYHLHSLFPTWPDHVHDQDHNDKHNPSNLWHLRHW